MERNKHLVMGIVTALLIMLAEYVLLWYRRPDPHDTIALQSTGWHFLIFVVAMILSFLPAIFMAFGGIHPAWGAMTTLVLNSFLWAILIVRYMESGLTFSFIQQGIFPVAVGITILSGIVAAALANTIRRNLLRLRGEEKPSGEKKKDDSNLMVHDANIIEEKENTGDENPVSQLPTVEAPRENEISAEERAAGE